MRELVGYVDGLSNLCGSEQRIRAAIAAGRERPVPAWQHHLGANFGGEALGRVGASPRAEMALPTTRGRWVGQDLQDCGDQWLLVQQHTWISPEGRSRERAPLPHRLAVIKPQGSNTKLVGQLHPHHQAKGRATAGCWPTVRRPPLVTRSQMARTRRDNAPVPPSSLRVVRDYSGSQTPMRNLTQYLEQLVASGTQPGELAVIPAAGPAPHLAAAGPGDGPDRLADHLDQPRLAGQPSPHQGGGSWTGELSWVGGDDQVLSPWRASWLVHQQIRLRGPCRRPPPPSGAVPAAGRPDQPLPLLGRGYLDQPRHRTGPWHHPA
jgi:hypothetical protein